MRPALVVDPAFVFASAGAAPLHLEAAVGAGDQRDERGRAAVRGLDRARRGHGGHRRKLRHGRGGDPAADGELRRARWRGESIAGEIERFVK